MADQPATSKNIQDLGKSINTQLSGISKILKGGKAQETKDKKYLELNKVLEIRKYCMNEQWRDPHFLTFGPKTRREFLTNLKARGGSPV